MSFTGALHGLTSSYCSCEFSCSSKLFSLEVVQELLCCCSCLKCSVFKMFLVWEYCFTTYEPVLCPNKGPCLCCSGLLLKKTMVFDISFIVSVSLFDLGGIGSCINVVSADFLG